MQLNYGNQMEIGKSKKNLHVILLPCILFQAVMANNV